MRRKRARTSSELRLNTSTPRAGSQTRPALRTGVVPVALSGVSGAPCVEGDDVRLVSLEMERTMAGPKGEVSLGLGGGVLGGGVDAPTGPTFGDAGLLGGVLPNEDLRAAYCCCAAEESLRGDAPPFGVDGNFAGLAAPDMGGVAIFGGVATLGGLTVCGGEGTFCGDCALGGLKGLGGEYVRGEPSI